MKVYVEVRGGNPTGRYSTGDVFQKSVAVEADRRWADAVFERFVGRTKDGKYFWRKTRK